MSATGTALLTIAENTPDVISVKGGEAVVSDITHDSRQVREGTLFVAIAGEHFDGHDFIPSARDMGATALLVERPIPGSIPQIVVRDSRAAMAWAARAVFGSPDASMRVAGVTGTNGKTTVTYMVESILRASNTSVGVIGTLGARVNGVPIPTSRTTPEASDLQRLLGTMRDTGVEMVMMEVSSHAIALHRSDAISFAVVGFTNLSRDHLDFHGDMESYFEVKRRLFRSQVADTSVVNIDDPWGSRLVSGLRMPVTTVSTATSADISASDLVGSPDGTSFDVQTPIGGTLVRLPLAGGFNVSNALVAIGIAIDVGVGLEAVAEGLSQLNPIAGRMEIIRHTGPFTAIVDYAHTPDAIQAVLQAVGGMAPARVISVIGAGGERDEDKRSLMGGAAARSSSVVIITTDNPRSEDPASIAAEVRRGALLQGGAEVMTVLDRSAAICRAIEIAQKGDIVMVLGKGHEQGQDVGTEILPFDDRQATITALADAGWETAWKR